MAPALVLERTRRYCVLSLNGDAVAAAAATTATATASAAAADHHVIAAAAEGRQRSASVLLDDEYTNDCLREAFARRPGWAYEQPNGAGGGGGGGGGGEDGNGVVVQWREYPDIKWEDALSPKAQGGGEKNRPATIIAASYCVRKGLSRKAQVC